MASGRPYLLPWLPDRQIYGDSNGAANITHTFMKRSCLDRRHTSRNINGTSAKNRWESHWDKKIFGALSCRSGNFRENQGNPIVNRQF